MTANLSLKKKPILLLYLLWGCLFVFFYLAIRQLNTEKSIEWTIPYLLRILGISMLLGSLSGLLVHGILAKLFTKQAILSQKDSVGLPLWKLSLGIGFLLFICSLPIWLAYYPGICAYDSYSQVRQIVEQTYNTHHPLFHTLILRFYLWIGTLLGHSNIGIALYTLVQLFLLSFACGYSVATGYFAILIKLGNNKAKWGALVLTLLYLICPFQPFMAISVTKDIPFSICFLLFTASLIRIILIKKSCVKLYALCLSSLFATILFRNNGIYAALCFAVSLALIAFLNRKKGNQKYSILAIGTILILLAGFIFNSLLAAVLHATPADKREMLSVPIQQIARVMAYHSSDDDFVITEAEQDLIDDFLLDQSYFLYDPAISDPVKRHTNTSVLLRRPKDFIKTYLHLFFRYPGEYVNAVLCTNAGFLSPADLSHASVNQTVNREGLGYIQTRWEKQTLSLAGIEQTSKWPSLFAVLEEWCSDNKYLQIPIIGFLMRPGLAIWLLLLIAIVLIERKNYCLLLPLADILGYYLTMLLGPTVQLRYIYPIMLVVPIYLSLLLLPQNLNEEYPESIK